MPTKNGNVDLTMVWGLSKFLNLFPVVPVGKLKQHNPNIASFLLSPLYAKYAAGIFYSRVAMLVMNPLTTFAQNGRCAIIATWCATPW